MTRSAQIEYAIGQLLIGGFEGTTVPRELTSLAERGYLGGAILFNRNFSSLAAARDLVSTLHALRAPVPLLLAVDQEGGRIQTLSPPFPQLPSMRAVGEAARKSLVHRIAGLLARALRVVGFHQDYAPVLDVDSRPDDPVIGDRAFSRDPNVVARLGAAFVDGLQSDGIAACGKHFPGHALPLLPHDLGRLMQVELVPFRAAIRAGVASIMTAHVVFPALDRDLEPLLRRELGFEGVIVADDLEKGAIAAHYGVEDAAVRALRAGCDQLILPAPQSIARAHEAIVRAVEQGALSADRVFASAARVNRLKAAYVYGRPGPVEGDLVAHLPTSEHAALLEALAAGPRPASPDPAEEQEFEFEGDPDERLELDV